ncbi:MAG: class I SAM-dependent methyltransferase [Coriobacteriia bacterium]|nr:class I SAM-dependent methyltransferase [Coriobacteriia bacterium]
MGFFNWAAPVFHRFANRWSEDHISEIADLLRPYAGQEARLLDLGGGTGALAVRLADALPATVTVLDPAPEMLRYLPQHERVTGLVGVAESLPFPDGSFDLAVVSDAFHHFRDQDGAVAQIARVLRPGGALFILDYDPDAIRFIVWAERVLGEPAAFFRPADLCTYLAQRGVSGTCVPTSARSYYFLGEKG